MALPPILRFRPAYFERIWGGHLMRDVLGMPVPQDKPIGEAWLISDHPHCESVISEGPLAGTTLREVMATHGPELLGDARPTPNGRFPLLLKLIDAGDLLSVQVHPDDAAAQRLGEPDLGKTEMWHVMHAEPGAEIVYGFKPGVDRAAFEAAIANGNVMDVLQRKPVSAGANVFVPAGTVHAIGAGLLIAEIQQNSDITYRIHDYDRVDAMGRPRELHLEKALQVVRFDDVMPDPHAGSAEAPQTIASCGYFSAREVLASSRPSPLPRAGISFHIVLATQGGTIVHSPAHVAILRPGEAALIPSSARDLTLQTDARALVYCS